MEKVKYIGAILLVTSIMASAQKKRVAGAKKQGEASAKIMIIGCGAEPRRKFKKPEQRSADGERLPEVVETEFGEVVPAQLYLRQPKHGAKRKNKTKKRKEKAAYRSIHIGFNRSVALATVAAGKPLRFFMRDPAKGGEYQHYFTLPKLDSDSQSLVLLSEKSHRARRWIYRPRVRVVRLDGKSMQGIGLMLLNLSREELSVNVGKIPQRRLLGNGGMIRYRVAAGYRLRMAARLKAEPQKNLINTAFRLSSGWLTVLVFFDADPATNSGKSVGVCRLLIEKKK